MTSDLDRIEEALPRYTKAGDEWRFSTDPAVIDAARVSLASLRSRLEAMEKERQLGPQTQRCDNTSCSMLSCGPGWECCPKCHEPLTSIRPTEAKSCTLAAQGEGSA